MDYVDGRLPAVFDHLDQARADLLAFTSLPTGVWTQIWSNNPNERLNREIRRRTDSVDVFPNRQAVIRLMEAVLAEQTDERAEGRRYLARASSPNPDAHPNPPPGGHHTHTHRITHPKDTKRLHHSTELDLTAPPPRPDHPLPSSRTHIKLTGSRANSRTPTRPAAAGEPAHGAPPLITDGDRPSILAIRTWHNPDSSLTPTTARPHALKKDDNPHPSPQPGNRLTPYDTTLALSPVQ